MKLISYSHHRFPPDIIRRGVWLYLRFTLSYRDVEDLLAERGLTVSNESIRRWVLKFGPVIAKTLRGTRPKPHSRWHLDEMVVSIAGRQMYMWRAVDSEGEVLEILVQPQRDKAAALRVLRKLLRRQGFGPKVFVTDKLRSYGAALREIGFSGLHEQGLRANNRAENSYQASTTRTRNARLQINSQVSRRPLVNVSMPPTSFRSPWQNGYAERLIRSVRVHGSFDRAQRGAPSPNPCEICHLL
jgi:putative transposase